MNKNLVIGLAVVLLLGAIGMVWLSNNTDQSVEETTSEQNEQIVVDEQNDPVVEDSTMEDDTSMLSDDEDAMMEDTNEITLEADEFFYSVDQVNANAGETVSLTLTNVGSMMHDFVVEGEDIQTSLLSPGDSETIEFTIDEPGTYTFYCSVNNHRAQGMEGTLVVE